MLKKYKEFILERFGYSTEYILDYLKTNDIDFDYIEWIGSGEYGEAFTLGNNTVLKITTSISEYEIAGMLLNKEMPGLVKFYWYDSHDKKYFLVMDELETTSNTEDNFFLVEDIIRMQGIDGIININNFDIEEYKKNYELDEDLEKFIIDLKTIKNSFDKLGLVSPDFTPENLGYDNNGNLKAFDIHDKYRLRNRMW